jgi:hypothetical protein
LRTSNNKSSSQKKIKEKKKKNENKNCYRKKNYRKIFGKYRIILRNIVETKKGKSKK